MECNLKDKASLANVKVMDSDEIGMRKFLNKADSIAQKEVKANKEILKAKDERIENQTRQYLKLEPKKEFILATREKILNGIKREDDGLVLGG